MSKHKKIVLLIALFSAVALALTVRWGAAYVNQLEAQRFSSEAIRLQIGKATAAQVLAIVKSSGHPTDGGFERCSSGAANCSGTIYFENYSSFTWLYRLHFATPMAFLCRFEIANNTLQTRSLEMVRADGGNISAFVREAESTKLWPTETLETPQQKYFKISALPSGPLGVLITPDTPSDLRALAYDFHFNCLNVWRDCKTPEEMLPVLGRKDLYWGQDPWKHGQGPAAASMTMPTPPPE